MKKSSGQAEAVIPVQDVARRIFLIRGHKVMIDRDLAGLYGVATKALNQAVKRNIRRFPSDFMFRLTPEETKQLVTNCDRFTTRIETIFEAIKELMIQPGKPARRIGFKPGDTGGGTKRKQ